MTGIGDFVIGGAQMPARYKREEKEH